VGGTDDTEAEVAGDGQAETRRLVGVIGSSMDVLGTAVAAITNRQAKQIKRTSRALRWTIVGLAVDIILTVVISLTVGQQRQNTADIASIQERSSTEALCPMYDVFLDLYNPNSPGALQDPALYERQFATFEAGARALRCKHVTRGRD
jgi:hypothetical protein